LPNEILALPHDLPFHCPYRNLKKHYREVLSLSANDFLPSNAASFRLRYFDAGIAGLLPPWVVTVRTRWRTKIRLLPLPWYAVLREFLLEQATLQRRRSAAGYRLTCNFGQRSSLRTHEAGGGHFPRQQPNPGFGLLGPD
jgi:hypothetical protein